MSNSCNLQTEGTSPREMDYAECSETSSDLSNSESTKTEESTKVSSIFDRKISIKNKVS